MQWNGASLADLLKHWIPAYAGMTIVVRFNYAKTIWIPAYAGMTVRGCVGVTVYVVPA